MGEQVDKHLNFSTCPLNGRMPFRSTKAPTAQSIRKITAKKWHAQEKGRKLVFFGDFIGSLKRKHIPPRPMPCATTCGEGDHLDENS